MNEKIESARYGTDWDAKHNRGELRQEGVRRASWVMAVLVVSYLLTTWLLQ